VQEGNKNTSRGKGKT